MLKPFTTERLSIRQLEPQDASELARISDVPAVSQWMAFMKGGFPLGSVAISGDQQGSARVNGRLLCSKPLELLRERYLSVMDILRLPLTHHVNHLDPT
jgi:hypothetical protein